MATNIDICNRALVMMGSQNKITSLTQDMLEADVLNNSYASVQDWCFSAANWDFARFVASLTQQKAISVPTTPWTSAEPAPPWLYQYAVPSDFIKAIYLTNSSINTTLTPNAYYGEPKRFVIACDEAQTPSTVLLTNETSGLLVYTARISDPTQWPMYFERFVVTVLAWTTCLSIMKNAAVFEALDKAWTRFFMLADQINREQGLVFGDTTPEWIQAIGIDYPFRRRQQVAVPGTQQQVERRPQGDNNR
jgi:hypothetical protein